MAQLFECFFPLMIIALFSFHTIDSASVQGLFGSQLNSNEVTGERTFKSVHIIAKCVQLAFNCILQSHLNLIIGTGKQINELVDDPFPPTIRLGN